MWGGVTGAGMLRRVFHYVAATNSCVPYPPQTRRALGIDFAPALTGFELQAGRSVPRIDGVVVCQVRCITNIHHLST